MGPDEIELHAENLKSIDFLNLLSPEHLMEVEKKLTRITFEKGDFIIKEGRSGGAFFILTQGSLSIIAEGHEKNEIIIGTLKPFTYFGEMALLTKSQRYTSLRAEEDVVVYMLGKEDFTSLLLSNPRVKENIERVAEERKHETDGVIYPDSENKDKKGSFFARIIGK